MRRADTGKEEGMKGRMKGIRKSYMNFVLVFLVQNDLLHWKGTVVLFVGMGGQENHSLFQVIDKSQPMNENLSFLTDSTTLVTIVGEVFAGETSR
jgi:hypothetical protein